MQIIDCHCDTITELFYKRKQNASLSLKENELHLDLNRMVESGYLLQNFALFLNLQTTTHPMEEALSIIDFYYEQLKNHKDIIAPAFSFQDIIDNIASGKLSAMLTLEEGGILEGKLSNLRNLYRLGARMMTLTWNYENEIAGPGLFYDQKKTPNPYKRNQGGGLTSFGFEVIEEMEQLGMMIDVSHLSDQGFYDVLHHTKKPFVASHSNSNTICPICRNLTDDMIKALSERGGFTGLNFCADFITPNHNLSHNIEELREKLIAHAKYIVNVGGIEVLALGSDFDGIDQNAWLKDASYYPFLYDTLKKNGFTESDLDKIFYKNVLRVYQEIL